MFWRRFARLCAMLLATLLVLSAVLITALRFGVPDLQPYRAWLLQEILPAELHGSVDQLHWRWQHYGVQIDLDNLSVQPASSSTQVPYTASLKQLSLHCNPFLMVTGRSCLTSVRGHDLHIRIDQSLFASKSSHRPVTSFKSVAEQWMAQLSQMDSLSLQQSSFSVWTGQHQAGQIQISDAQLENTESKHQLAVHFEINREGLQVPLLLQADFTGPATLNSLVGQWSLQTTSSEHTELDQLVPDDLKNDIHQVRGHLDFHFQMVRQPGQWQSARLDLGENRLLWQQDGQLHQLAIQGGDFTWSRQEQGWLLQSHQLQLHTDAQPWRDWHTQLSRHGDLYEGQMDALQLNELTPLVAMFLPVGSQAGDILKTMDPLGTISGIQFSSDTEHQHWQLKGQLTDLSWHRWQTIPQMGGLDANVIVDPQGVTVALNQPAPQSWDLTPMFGQAWQVQQFSGRLHWQSGKDGGELEGKDLVLNTDAAQTTTQFKLTKLTSPDIELHLKTIASVPDVKQIPQYYPRLLMGQALVKYLSDSIQGGSVSHAEITWDGILNHFPFQDRSGKFRAFVPLRNSTFQFDPAWKPLHDLDLDLEFVNDRLDMVSHQATLGGAQIPRLYAWFDHLLPGAHLQIDADVNGDAKDVTRYLTDSPLKNTVGKALAAIQVSHALNGNLKLDIPIDGSQVKASGNVNFANNQVEIPEIGLTMKNAQGALLFDNTKTALDNLTGTVDGQPVHIHYVGEQKEKEYLVQLTTQGSWSSQLQQWGQNQTLADSFSGQTDWDGKLELHLLNQGGFHYKANLESTLNGLRLNMPFPYQKMPGRSWPLVVNIAGDQNNSHIQGHLNREWLLNAIWKPQQHQFSKFWLDNLVIEDNSKPRPPLSVKVLLSQANLTNWLSWLQGVNTASSGSSFVSALPKQGEMDFDIDRLSVADQEWLNVHANVSPSIDGHLIQLSSDNVAGLVQVPANVKLPIQVDLQRLYWADTSNGKKATPMSLAEQKNWLAHWPHMQFTCRDLRYSGNTFGYVSGEFIPLVNGGVIKDLSWQVASASFTGQATWQIIDNRPVSTTKGVFKNEKSDVFLSHFGFNPAITGASSEIDLNLNWPGALTQPGLEKLNGNIKVKMKDGVLRQVKNTNSSRLLSLFSLESLVNRMNLDFRDIFSEGMYFKSIEFTGKLNRGEFQNHDLKLESNSGELSGQGTINFATNLVDYDVKFIPRLTLTSGGLGSAAAFAITPITGIYVLAATTVLRPVFDMITQVNYNIKGNIDKPTVTEVGRKHDKVKLPKENKTTGSADATGRTSN